MFAEFIRQWSGDHVLWILDGGQHGYFFYLQTSEDAVLKWSEKQKTVYSAHTSAGTKKGEGLPVTPAFPPVVFTNAMQLLCVCRHQLVISIHIQSRICGAVLV